jgi:hypothetical protein
MSQVVQRRELPKRIVVEIGVGRWVSEVINAGGCGYGVVVSLITGIGDCVGHA